MDKITRILLTFISVLGLLPAVTQAQSFTSVGARAQGMGGAFVGVADDATAIYWNPAGLAAGSFFSLALDHGVGESTHEGTRGGRSKGTFIGLSMPALGLGYYRLAARSIVPSILLLPVDEVASSRNLSAVAPVRVDSLVTQHTGLTLVQSLIQGVAVGTTLKAVRGRAGSTLVDVATVEEALDSDGDEVFGDSGTAFDLDIGLMASGGGLKVGLTLRNVLEPGFQRPGAGEELTLERQARAGMSYAFHPNWLAAADFDLLRSRDAFGERRDIAFGVEGRIIPRAYVRSGISFNTVDTPGVPRVEDERGAAYSIGGSYAAKAAVFIDGHFTAGKERTGRRWSVAARFVY